MITQSHIKALARAVIEAGAWRGTLVGNPDTTDLKEFDKFIAKADEAIKIIKKLKKEGKLNG